MLCAFRSRYLFINCVSLLWGLQKVIRHLRRNLSLFCPLPNRIEVLALMFRIEIHKSFWSLRIPPHLPQDSSVWHTHELLANDVHAMSDMEANNVVVVFECAFALGFVVVVIEVKCLSEQVQTMEVV